MKYISRRTAIGRGTAGLAALGSAAAITRLLAAEGGKRIEIGACDWSLGKAADPAAFDIAKEIGLDGVQVSLGSMADNLRVRRPEVQKAILDAAKRTGLRVLSVGLSELNNIPYKSDPRTVEWVADSIDVCRALGCRVVLLAFFHKDDLRNDAKGVDETVRRLKEVAPKAEKAGVILGIESWLTAEQHMEIIQRVGSPAVKVYYDVANSTEVGCDIIREIRLLGKEGLICEFHMKENGALLGRGKIDFQKVRAAIEEISYKGPMQIEGAIPPGGKLIESYTANLKFLRALFG